MSAITKKLAEVYRRAITPGVEGYISNDVEAAQRAAVENVKRNVLARHALYTMVAEWAAAKEKTKKWSLRK